MARRPDPRHTVQHVAAKALASEPDARPDVDSDRAADPLYGLLSPELYLVFARDRGWSPEVWQEWACAALTAHLCTDQE